MRALCFIVAMIVCCCLIFSAGASTPGKNDPAPHLISETGKAEPGTRPIAGP
jgi:hypothetical protein